MLTKQSIQNMEENELCHDVIIPLLRSMGFKDVNFYHGGIGEQGKDIVCWKDDVLGVRKNYALVVKHRILLDKQIPEKDLQERWQRKSSKSSVKII